MAEKTEGLTYVEAIKVFARSEETGERIVDNGGAAYWIENGRPGGLYGWPEPSFGPFRVIKPQPKSLTYEEALKCENVRIHWPTDTGSTHVREYQRRKGTSWEGLWDSYTLTSFDLAERRGYLIEEVKG